MYKLPEHFLVVVFLQGLLLLDVGRDYFCRTGSSGRTAFLNVVEEPRLCQYFN